MAAEFGRALRAHRRRARLTQAQVGQRVGYHHSLISKVESGARTPPRGLAVALDEVLGTGGELAALDIQDSPQQTLLSLLPGAAAGGVPIPLRRWPAVLPAAGIGCPEHGAVACRVPAAGSAHALLARLGRERPGPDLVHVLTALLHDCAATDALAPVEWALHRLAPADSRALLTLAAHYARVAGRLRAARGQDALGMAWLGQGLTWAAAAGDAGATARLLGDVAALTRVDVPA
ncbi:helix-turn-helix transcriptional regulator [Actinokineospora sp. PR83]|uniref:helix-turn-helix domain-containing protein n=1 Tax=Actinokineospora sp. PR83 TaxID=2884908 RepID=UPI0027E10C9A|nr:helix-turn-helix transcriptional regulator [Actinokineospora sp. PR83]MCG8918752.1 helix-turn-helix transcriptional regulator [Actinokineospora sp. PR83]